MNNLNLTIDLFILDKFNYTPLIYSSNTSRTLCRIHLLFFSFIKLINLANFKLFLDCYNLEIDWKVLHSRTLIAVIANDGENLKIIEQFIRHMRLNK